MVLTRSSSVCALVPHYEGHDWLAGAIESLLAQTRPLDAIVVIDDGSAVPPADIVNRYGSVTLLVATHNAGDGVQATQAGDGVQATQAGDGVQATQAGPYRLVQTVIDQTDFDAYLFQDADDLSHPERLASLLAVAEQNGAGMVGSHEVELNVVAPEVRRREFPLDVNAVLAQDPIAFALLHPTSLVAREAVVRCNGFAGLPFSGDVDFLWRAGHVTRIVNADRHLYLRRRHPRSLTGAPSTGTGSPARQELEGELRARARANARRVAQGEAPDLSPFAPCEPVPLQHVAGPDTRTRRGGPMAAPLGPSTGGPVFVIGGPRNGGDVVAWALDRHPQFEAGADMPSASHTRRPIVSGPAVTCRAFQLAADHPGAQFVFVDRDVESTVASLATRPDTPDDFYTPESARAIATRMNAIGDAALAALGPARVHRVALADLVRRPEGTLREVLAFLGAPMTAGLALPLVGLAIKAANQTPPTADTGCVAAGAPAYEPIVARLRRLVAPHIDGEAVVAVVSKGDPALLELGAGRAQHFPAIDGGVYAGEYPATGDTAVELVELARAEGVTHLLIPAPAAWWLTHYPELGAHLTIRSRAVAARNDTGTLYDLTVANVVDR